MRTRLRQVALIYDARSAYDLKVMSGVAAFVQQSLKWNIYIEENVLKDQRLPDLHSWKGDGVIADFDHPHVASAIVRSKLPAVGFGSGYGWYAPALSIPYFYTNNHAISVLAADHLIERGFRHFAYCGYPRGPVNGWSAEREEAFQQHLAVRHLQCHVYRGRHQSSQQWVQVQHSLGAWLKSLPKPVGLMAANDSRGRQVLEACRTHGLRVPQDVAVVGVDNDELLCRLSSPLLSSVEQGARRLGFEAAALLDQIMERRRGGKPRDRRFVIDPIEVVTRSSTEVLATDDPKVVEAVAFIAQHFSRGMKVADIVKAVGVSRSSLERRFKDALGCTVRAGVRRFQLDRARRLISDTDMPLKQVAAETGFPSVQHMTTLFGRAFGQSPARYRASTAGRYS